MKRLEYLKLALTNKLYENKNWLFKAFSITRETKTSLPYDLIKEPWGYAFLDNNNEYIKIDDSKQDQSLFNFSEKITIDPTWIPNLKESSVETTIGRLLFNYIVLVNAFNDKIPYINEKVNIGKIDKYIASKLKDTPLTESGDIDHNAARGDGVIYVDEYLNYVDSFKYLGSISQLTTIAATKRNILPPTGIKEFKEKLLKKYEGKLDDPVEVVKFEKELKDFDEQYLKDDPSNGKFMSGKVKNIARKKMFLDIGLEEGFKKETKAQPILNSLEDGWSTDPETLVKMYNGSRSGSYSRGAETVQGGVSAKVLLRASNTFSIANEDCGSKLGIEYKLEEDELSNLIDRYIITNNGIKLIENIKDASNYIGKSIRVRSPMYCLEEGLKICEVCAGRKLSKFTKGLSIPVTEISSLILISSLKKMHGVSLTTTVLNLNKDLS